MARVARLLEMLIRLRGAPLCWLVKVSARRLEASRRADTLTSQHRTRGGGWRRWSRR